MKNTGIETAAGALRAAAVCAALAGGAWAAAVPAAPAAVPAGASTVETTYTGDRSRDPFLKAASAGSAPKKAVVNEPGEFSIHVLTLRAVMRDQGSSYAIVADNGQAISYIFRNGKLYDPKGKLVPGVGGSINIKAKAVTLKTQDGDEQILRLGEEEKGSNP